MKLIIADIAIILILIVFCIVSGIFLGSPLPFHAIVKLAVLFTFILKLATLYHRLRPRATEKPPSRWETHLNTH